MRNAMLFFIFTMMLVGVSGFLAYKSIRSKKDLMVILIALYLGLTPAILFFVDELGLFLFCVAMGLLSGAVINVINHIYYIKEDHLYN